MAVQGGFGVLLKIDVSGLTTVANLLGLEKHAAWDDSVLDIR